MLSRAQSNRVMVLWLSLVTLLSVMPGRAVVRGSDPAPGELSFTVSASSMVESAGGQIQVQRLFGSDGTVSVDWMLGGGSASPGVDYVESSGTLEFAEGVLALAIPVEGVDDDLLEGDETVVVTLSNPIGGATLGSRQRATIEITDDEDLAGRLTTAAVVTVPEGGTAVIQAHRQHGGQGAVTAAYATADGSASADADYTAASGSLVWADGVEGPASFSVVTLDDVLSEGDETLHVTLSAAAGGLLLDQPTITIVVTDDDGPASGGYFFFGTNSPAEDDASGLLTVNVFRNGGAGPGSIDVTTADDTALAGSDYTATMETLSWGNDDFGVRTAEIPLLDDVAVEGDETIRVGLSNADGGAGTILGTQLIATVIDDERGTPSQLAPIFGGLCGVFSFPEVDEDDDALTVAFMRTIGSSGTTTVEYETRDATATAGTDYGATSGTLTWLDGDTESQCVTIPISDDVEDEGDIEQFELAFSNAVNGLLDVGARSVLLTIRDDDEPGPGSVRFANAEGLTTESDADEATVLTVERISGAGGPASVDFAVTGGTADVPGDALIVAGTLHWADGEAGGKAIDVTIVGDDVDEPPETVQVTLSNAVGAALGSPDVMTLTIADDDAPSNGSPLLAPVGDRTIPEGETSLITVSASDPDPDDVITLSVDNLPSFAIFTDNGDGTGTIELSPGFDAAGTYPDILITAHDGQASDSETITITVTNVNAAPSADDQSLSTPFETPLELSLTGVDPDDDPITFSVASQPSNGELVCTTLPDCTYTPDDGFSGSDSFTYTASDGDLTSEPATVTISVEPDDSPPQAFDDLVTLKTNTTASFTLNAFDPDGASLTYTILTQPEHGTLDCEAAPACTYAPDLDFVGEDAFTFKVNDGVFDSSVATVSLSVVLNAVPDAVDDEYLMLPGTTLSFTVTDNDSDPDSDPLTVTIATQPAVGTLSCNDDGGCQYTPPAGFTGTVTFTYTLDDGFGGTDTATVTITVEACPVMAPALDDGGLVTGEAWIACSHSRANAHSSLAASGLTSSGGISGLLTSGLAANAAPPDNTGAKTAAHDVDTTLRGAYDVSILRLDLAVPPATNCLRFDFVFGSEEYPEWVGQFNDAFLAELDVNDWSVSGNDITAPNNFAFDPNGATVSVNSTFFNANQVVTPNGTQYDGATRVLRAQTPVTPGTHSLYLSVFDAGDAGFDSGVWIDRLTAANVAPGECSRGANTPPNAADDAFVDEDALLEDTPAQLDLLHNDSDPDGDTLTIVSATDPEHGELDCSSHPCTYTPDPNYFGPDTFSYVISDGRGGTDSATVTLDIAPVNDAPVADDVFEVGVEPGEPRTITLSAHDIDGTSLTFAIVNEPEDGTLGSIGTPACTTAPEGLTCTADVVYTANPGATGTDTFTYIASDGALDSAPATVEISFVAAPPDPSIGITSASVTEGTGLNFTEMSFVVSLSSVSDHAITVAYATQAGTATSGNDFQPASGTAMVPAGQAGTTVTVNVVADAADEPDETLSVELSSPTGATLDPSASTAGGTIIDDDAAPAVSISDANRSEGDTGTNALSFVVTLSAPSGRTVTGSASTVHGTTAFDDYIALVDQAFSVPAGDTSAMIEVDVIGDTAVEPNETFNVTLGNLVNASAGDISATGTILNDDAAAIPTVSIADLSRPEGDAQGVASFAVTLSAPPSSAVTVQFNTSSGTATAPADFTARSGVVSFAPGDQSEVIDITTVGDLLAEPDETFTVHLTSASGATILDGAAVGTLENDDDCTIVGTNGNDNLRGTSGPDVICARDGNDTVNGLSGGDVLRGGNGIDRVTYFDAPNGATVDLAAGTASGWGSDALESIEEVIGSEHADVISGDGGANLLSGLGGADQLRGRGGDDVLFGLDGADAVDGGTGADEVFGNDGNDQLIGDAGNDDILGGNGTDLVDYRGAPNAVIVNLQSNTATGWGTDGLSLVENVFGSLFGDTLTGNNGPNALSGSGGADTLVGAPGNDELRGGDGSDTADYSPAKGPVAVNLRARSATGDGDDFVENIENVIGTDRADSLVGDDGSNLLIGLSGDDSIMGWLGNDDLRGGLGVDTVLYNALGVVSSGMTINLNAGSASGSWGNDQLSLFENAFGTPFADTIIGTDGANEIHSLPGSDTVNALGGADTVFAGEGNDSVAGGAGNDDLNGNEGNDTVNGQAGTDTLAGQEGADTLIGGDGKDSLSGGEGQDELFGNEDNDTLVGGPGPLADTLNGGSGKDTCFDSAGVQDVKVSCEKT